MPPPFIDLWYFVLSVRMRTSAAAAALLGIQPNSISMAIRRLENQLGRTLIVREDKKGNRRGARQISLTADGKAYFNEVVDLFDELDRTTRNYFGVHLFASPSVRIHLLVKEKWLISLLRGILRVTERDGQVEPSSIKIIDCSYQHNLIDVPAGPIQITIKRLTDGELPDFGRTVRVQNLFIEDWCAVGPANVLCTSMSITELANRTLLDASDAPLRWQDILPMGSVLHVKRLEAGMAAALPDIAWQDGILLCDRHLLALEPSIANCVAIRLVVPDRVVGTVIAEIPATAEMIPDVRAFLALVNRWLDQVEDSQDSSVPITFT